MAQGPHRRLAGLPGRLSRRACRPSRGGRPARCGRGAGAAHRGRGRGVRSAGPRAARPPTGRGAPAVHGAGGGSDGRRAPCGAGAAACGGRLPAGYGARSRRSADLVVVGNPDQSDVGAAPGRRARRARPPGPHPRGRRGVHRRGAGRTRVLAPLLAARHGARTGTTEPRLPGSLVVLRSLTKTWGLAGLRIGYVLSDAATVAVLARAQPLWPVSAPALAAAEACCGPHALAEAGQAALRIADDRAHLLARLGEFTSAGLFVHGSPQAPFVLARHPEAASLRDELRTLGFAVRRGDTFPGLGRRVAQDRRTGEGVHGPAGHGPRQGARRPLTAVTRLCRQPSRGCALSRHRTVPSGPSSAGRSCSTQPVICS